MKELGSEDDEFLRVAAVYSCMELLSRRGWQVAETEAKSHFDVFALKGNKTIKIQVRSSKTRSARKHWRFRTGKIRFNTKRMERTHFAKGDFDYWFFYSKSGDRWLMPFKHVKTRSEIVLDERYDRWRVKPIGDGT